MATKELIEQYFKAIHGGDWQSYISDDFTFTNGNLDKVAHGKAAYVEGAGRFFGTTTAVDIRHMIIQDRDAAVLARYDVRSPKGHTGVCDVAEFLTVDGDQLTASTIIFDVQGLAQFMAQS